MPSVCPSIYRRWNERAEMADVWVEIVLPSAMTLVGWGPASRRSSGYWSLQPPQKVADERRETIGADASRTGLNDLSPEMKAEMLAQAAEKSGMTAVLDAKGHIVFDTRLPRGRPTPRRSPVHAADVWI